MDRLKSALPASLHADLTLFGEELKKGGVEASRLQSILSQLDSVPAAGISRADGEIAYLANLYHQPLHIRPALSILSHLPVLVRDYSHSELLMKTPDLQYLFIFHRDGRLREAALNRITEPRQSPFFFAAISYRLNDWAVQVRLAAKACAARVFPKTNPEIIAAAAVFLLAQRQHWRRWYDEWAVLDQAFSRSDVADHLAAMIREASTGPMGRLLRQALRGPEIDRHLLTLARSANLPAVRAAALQTLLDGRATWHSGFERKWIDKSHGESRRVATFGERQVSHSYPLDELVTLGAQDSSAAVRKVATDGMIRHRHRLSNLDYLIDLLRDDRSKPVRERIEFIQREAAGI